MSSRTQDMMEQENNLMAENLANKISRLKQISIGIKDDIDGDNRYLSGKNVKKCLYFLSTFLSYIYVCTHTSINNIFQLIILFCLVFSTF